MTDAPKTRVEMILRNISTADLVTELASREGVHKITIDTGDCKYIGPIHKAKLRIDGSRCHAPQARSIKKPDKTGGVRLGNVCWVCKNDWWVQK